MKQLLILLSFVLFSCHDVIQYDNLYIDYKDIESKEQFINGYNTVTVIFPNDTIRLNPTNDGYVLYSYMETEPFPIDWLYTSDAKSFIWWVAQYPLDISDSHVENPNIYYRELLLEKIYE